MNVSLSLQEELERLNQASEEINQLELQLDVSGGRSLMFNPLYVSLVWQVGTLTSLIPPPAGCPHRLPPHPHRVRQAPELSGHSAGRLHRESQTVLRGPEAGQGGEGYQL